MSNDVIPENRGRKSADVNKYKQEVGLNYQCYQRAAQYVSNEGSTILWRCLNLDLSVFFIDLITDFYDVIKFTDVMVTSRQIFWRHSNAFRTLIIRAKFHRPAICFSMVLLGGGRNPPGF